MQKPSSSCSIINCVITFGLLISLGIRGNPSCQGRTKLLADSCRDFSFSQPPNALGFCVFLPQGKRDTFSTPLSVFFSMVTTSTGRPTQALVGGARVFTGLLLIPSALGLGN